MSKDVKKDVKTVSTKDVKTDGTKSAKTPFVKKTKRTMRMSRGWLP